MTRAFFKDVLREIRHSMGRFISILTIIMLGVAFFAGLRAAGPDMRAAADGYFRRQKLMDVQLLSTLGFSEEDVRLLRAQEGVAHVMPTYAADALLQYGDEQLVAKVKGLGDGSINVPELIEGRMPAAAGECLVEQGKFLDVGIAVGEKVTFSSGTDGDILDTLASREFTVVGIAQSPEYISFERGTSTVGSGSVDTYVLIPDGAFVAEYYTAIYLSVAGADALDTFSRAYKDTVGAVTQDLETLGEARAPARREELLAQAWEEIADGQAELADGRQTLQEELQKARQELADAQRKIEDGQQEYEDGQREYDRQIADAEKQLSAAQKKLDAGKREYQAGKAEFDAQKAAAEAKFAAGEAELAQAKAQLDASLAELQSSRKTLDATKAQLADARKTLEATKAQLAEGKAQLDAAKAQLDAAREQLGAAEAAIAKIEQAIASGALTGDALAAAQQQLAAAQVAYAAGKQEYEAGSAEYEKQAAAYAAGKAQYDAGEASYAAGKAQYDEGEAAWEAGKARYDAGLAAYQAGKEEIAAGRQELEAAEAKLAAARRQLESGAAELARQQRQFASEKEKGRRELEDAQKELDEGRREIADGWAEYRKAEREGWQEIADGEAELADARAEIADIPACEWYVLDRGDNPGFGEYESAANRMDALAQIFPVIFFLVAALVSLNGMTRMVDEQRSFIGTMKGLGYSQGAIAMKYILYAGAASILGSVIGVAWGIRLFPWVVVNAYSIMFTFPPMEYAFYPDSALTAAVLAVALVAAASYLACRRELAVCPAELMRPKAPRAGKRVLLERIGFLWRRLNFTQKVTMRNLFRYKKRMVMTICGIAGSMALLLAGFGIQDSVSDVVQKQFGEIDQYGLMVGVDAEKLQEGMDAVTGALGDVPMLQAYGRSLDVQGSGEKMEATLMVPQDPAAFGEYIVLRERIGRSPLALADAGVILPEKTARMTGAAVGDTITLSSGGGEARTAVVTGITEHYAGHYVYMSTALYGELYGAAPEYNMLFVKSPKMDEAARAAAAEQMMRSDAVRMATFSEDTMQVFEDMIDTLKYVVMVLVAAAGALSFLILYNLTNINVSERFREIATIKVLGFYDKEVVGYVFRENFILTGLGAAIGCALGVALHQYIITTVEVDAVMFGRDINPESFLWSLLLIVVFALLVNFVMHFKLRKIDMVEALKTVE